MWMIAGLGNPERKYVGTRHNAGFEVIDALCDILARLPGPAGHPAFGGRLNETKFKGAYARAKFKPGLIMRGGEGLMQDEDVELLLLKPLTYMNASGECISPMANYYKIPPSRIIVCSDDVALETGRLRIRQRGSAGGHNGLKSIIECLGTEDFPRVRIGVGGKPDRMDLASHVLAKFNEADGQLMKDVYREAAKACLEIITLGPEKAMNAHNTKKAKPEN